MLNGDYIFERYSVALPRKEGDHLSTGVAANEARALRARSHIAYIKPDCGKPECVHRTVLFSLFVYCTCIVNFYL